MESDGLIAYSKKILLSAMENICWKRGRLGSGRGINRQREICSSGLFRWRDLVIFDVFHQDQESANEGRWAKFGPPLFLSVRVYLETATPILLHIVCGCLGNSSDGDPMA